MISEEVKQRILALHDLGKTYSQIAEMAQVSRSSVFNVVKQHEQEMEDDFEEDDESFGEIEELEKEAKKNGGLSGAELIDLHRAKLEGTMKVMDYKHRLREERKNNDHKRQVELLKAEEELKAKEQKRIEQQKKEEKKAKAEKEFYQKRDSLHEQILEFANNFLLWDKKTVVTAGDIDEQRELGNKLGTQLAKLLKESGLTKAEIDENTHLKAIKAIDQDLFDTLEDNYDDDDEYEMVVERAVRAKITPLLSLETIEIDLE